MKSYKKSSERIALICSLFLLAASSNAGASVSVGVTLFNSDSSVSESITVENANYASSALLLPYNGFADFPYSIHSSGAGSSTSSDGKFTDTISAVRDGEDASNVDASVETKSGSFRWSKSVDSSDDIAMSMGIATQIVNGELDSSYTNSDSSVAKEISTRNSMYSDKSYITSGSLGTQGSGSSLDEMENAFVSHVEAQHLGKTALVDSDVFELTDTEGADHKFSDIIKLGSDSGSLAGSVSILSNNKCELLPMTGIVSGPIIAAMKFTPFYTATEKNIFEVQTVPKDGTPMSFRAVERTMPGDIKTFESVTLSMTAKWT